MTRTFCDGCGKEQVRHDHSLLSTVNHLNHGVISLSLAFCHECAQRIQDGLNQGQRIQFSMVPQGSKCLTPEQEEAMAKVGGQIMDELHGKKS